MRAQDALTEPGRWTAGLVQLENSTLRAQWKREWLTAPPFTNAFDSAIDEFTQRIEVDDFALCEKVFVWFQAQHTVPSPIIMQGAMKIEGVDSIRLADLFGWPSDGEAWGRLIDWILARHDKIPARLIPQALEVLGVWQNALSEIKNPRSKKILATCSSWLTDLETEIYAQGYDRPRGKWDALGHEAQKRLATGLRSTILRSARSYPEFAVALFERAASDEHMLRSAFDDLMGFTPIMAAVAPEAVEKVADAKLLQELPQDKFDRLRQQKMALSSVHFPTGMNDFRLDEVGLDEHNHYYHPPSALHEPFASLLAKSPAIGLRFIKKLTNHATTGWRQIHKLSRREHGTPIPVVLEMPWSKQEFWGDWHVFCWGLGMSGSELLQCAYLALNYWAFKEIEKGRSSSDLIKDILEGSECYATLGLCLRLAIETFEISETTFPIVTCQRLWEHDMARLIQEPQKDIDLFGLGFLTKPTGEKAKAKAFLDSREYRKHEVRELAMRFVITSDTVLRDRFKKALAAFPDDLPFDVEEQRGNEKLAQNLKEKAELWSGLGDIENYRRYEMENEQVAIGYEPPKPVPEVTQQKAEKASESLGQSRVLNWAQRSLNEGKLADGWSLDKAIEYAKKQDRDDLFDERADVGPHAVQSSVSAIAACVIRFGDKDSADRSWAWNVMNGVLKMREPGNYRSSKIPWHPSFHMISALFHDRKSSAPRADSAASLIQLASHANDEVQLMAFQALFLDPDPHVKWVAAHYAFDLAHYIAPIKDENTFDRDDTEDREARKAALAKALHGLSVETEDGFAPLPPPWVKASHRNIRKEEYWTAPKRSFDGQYAAKLFAPFPLEEWCRSDVYREKIGALLADLARWTTGRLMPAWDEKKRRDRQTHLYEWDHELGKMFARVLPFFDLDWMRENFVKPFSEEYEEALRVLAEFAGSIVIRHVMDAKEMPANTLPILDDCVERVVRDRTFKPGGYRAGEVSGYDMPDLIKALLFVNIEADCPGAARFANGDWSDIAAIMPLVTKLMKAAGWSAFVMQRYLTLCEKAGTAYPLDAFIDQAGAALDTIEYAKGSWVGTSLPARLAAIIQSFAGKNYPLEVNRARGLLRLLDALIDLGDRRSAALEQNEAFRRVQGSIC